MAYKGQPFNVGTGNRLGHALAYEKKAVIVQRAE